MKSGFALMKFAADAANEVGRKRPDEVKCAGKIIVSEANYFISS